MAATPVSPTSGPYTASPDGDHRSSNGTATNESVRSTDEAHVKHIPTLIPVKPEAPKRYQDVLAYEDKWIGWDGPVWCKRYGRFENADNAARDDGFKSSGQVHHQDLGSHHKHSAGCTCKVPVEHRSYAEDIKRRIEPMVASLVSLEHQVANLGHRFSTVLCIPVDDKVVKGTEVMDNHHHEVNERYAMHDDGLSHHANHAPPHKNEALAKLEREVNTLQHQLQELMKRNGSAKAFVRNT